MGEEPDNIRGRQRKQPSKNTGSVEYRIRPTDARILKQMHWEYREYCQKTFHTVPDFHNFMVQMAKYGYYAWQEKNKRA